MRLLPRLSLLLFLLVPLLARPASPSAAPAASGWTAVDSVIAVVNQDVILRSDFDRRVSALKTVLEQIKDPAERTKRRIELRKQILGSLIDERLVFQASLAMGLTAVGPEVDRAVAEVKAKNKIDDAALAKVLAENGYTMAQYREEIQRQILQAKLSNLVFRPRVHVSDEELRAAYKEAQKRDPQHIGKFEEVKQPLQERMLEDAMMREQLRWLGERRAEAYIDVRVQP
ncbi:MAG TPA: SurA N-terminal domain-containing protein [Kofleriaceae bacterium]|nr:SurA N-terminal domain-containing protein [Kofleriaceae bacterium]